MSDMFTDHSGFRTPEKHGGEELWLVSYADMMTLLFGFFVILFSFSVVEEKSFQEFSQEISKSLGGEQAAQTAKSQVGMMNESRQIRALQMLVAMLNLGDNIEDGVTALEKKVASEGSANTAKESIMADFKQRSKDKSQFSEIIDHPTQRDVTVDIMLSDKILFAAGSDVLLPDAIPRLKEVAESLAKVNGLSEITVVGHTDSRPPKSGKYTDNWALSAARAASVAKELIKFGVSPKFTRTSGMSDIQPLFPERSPDGRMLVDNMAKNRRVHILVKKVQDARTH